MPAQWTAHGIEAMGGGSPSGYIWAQFQFITLARHIWQTAGTAAFGHFHQHLRDASLTDEAIADALSALDPRVASAVRHWPHLAHDLSGG
jgi:hypothetical protein